jgi:anti-sigma regulatory factor (Ser/Thr protein kinase)
MSARNAAQLLGFGGAIVGAPTGKIEISGADLKWIDPFGMCIFSEALVQACENGSSISFIDFQDDVVSYLHRMDLFTRCNIACANLPDGQRGDLAGSLVEIRVIDAVRHVEPASQALTQALIGLIPDIDRNAGPDEMTGYTPEDRIFLPLRHIFSELLENALTHGRRQGYSNARVIVAAQYYPTSGMIRLGIIDNGCGFLGSLKNHRMLGDDPTHLSAIKLALQPKISCNRDVELMPDQSHNQGVGLTVASNIVREASGLMTLISGDAGFRIGSKLSGALDIKYWQGVGIAIEMRREGLGTFEMARVLPRLPDSPMNIDLNFEE